VKAMWLPGYAVCLLLGIALWRLAPSRWELDLMQALALGSGLYFGALHRYISGVGLDGDLDRWGRRFGVLAGLAGRGGLFVALVGVQAYFCYEVMPNADVRGGFILTSTWLMALAVIDRPGKSRVLKTA